MTEHAIDQQANAFSDSVAVRVRDDLLLVELRGEDQRSWLNGQLTNDVRQSTPGDGIYSLAVNVRGKIMGEVWVLDRAGELAVLLPRDAAPGLLESFESQIIMEDVELEPQPETAVISAQGPRAADLVSELDTDRCFACDELGSGGRFVLAGRAELEQVLESLGKRATALGGGPVDEAAYELARLRAGRPRFARDFGEKNYPQEAGLGKRAVSFSKGCYLGQEVVCTLENRGRLSRRLANLEVVAGEPQPADELRDAEGKAVGALTSLAYDPLLRQARAFGYIKTASATPGTQLAAGGAQLVVKGLIGEN
jgi:folate-binding protein YgfZ